MTGDAPTTGDRRPGGDLPPAELARWIAVVDALFARWQPTAEHELELDRLLEVGLRMELPAAPAGASGVDRDGAGAGAGVVDGAGAEVDRAALERVLSCLAVQRNAVARQLAELQHRRVDLVRSARGMTGYVSSLNGIAGDR